MTYIILVYYVFTSDITYTALQRSRGVPSLWGSLVFDLDLINLIVAVSSSAVQFKEESSLNYEAYSVDSRA